MSGSGNGDGRGGEYAVGVRIDGNFHGGQMGVAGEQHLPHHCIVCFDNFELVWQMDRFPHYCNGTMVGRDSLDR